MPLVASACGNRVDSDASLDAVVAVDATDAPAVDADASPGLPVGVHVLASTDFDAGLDDLEALAPIVSGAQVVGVGESIHTSGGYLHLRTRVLRYLVTRQGFRTVAIEGTRTPVALVTEAYVQSCAGTPEAATQVLNPIWWDRSTPEVLRWMCEWNRDHPTDRVHIFGFDIRQPWTDRPALEAYLTRVAPVDAAALVAGISQCLGVGFADEAAFFMDPTVRNYYGGTRQVPVADHNACTAGGAALTTYLSTHHAALVTASSEREYQLARLAVLDVVGFDGSIFYVSRGDLAHANPPRDDAMAEVFRTIRALDFPGSRTMLWAHNGHIMQRSSEVLQGQWTGVRNMATQIADDASLNYVAIGQFSYVTRYNWTAGLAVLDEPGPDWLEYTLEQLHAPLLLVDTAAASAGSTPLIDRTFEYGAGFDVLHPDRNYQVVLFQHESPPADYFTGSSPFGR